MQLRIAVISDLHCHKKTANNKQASYLLTNEEASIFQDPFKSLEHFANKTKQNLNVDILLMPGDFGDKCDNDGIKKGWEVTKAVGKLFNAKTIIPNIGNHDVNSRDTTGADPFAYIKSFSPDFPFQDQATNKDFWENGYLLIEEEKYRILLINSVHSHTNEKEARHGLISQEAINAIEESLRELDPDKLGIAMVHHCPIEHSHYNTGSEDFMYNGDELTSLLDTFNFDLIIHGHKHDPRIRYSPGGGNAPVIFSSGSFAAHPEYLLQGAYNTFHIITLDINEHRVGRGLIDTWFWIASKGWNQDVSCKYIEPRIGFGAVVDLKDLSNNILQWFQRDSKTIIDWDQFIQEFPDIDYIIPSDFKKLKQNLKLKNIYISAKAFDDRTFVQYQP